MLRFLETDFGMVVESGFIYLPLLFDQDIHIEIQDLSNGMLQPSQIKYHTRSNIIKVEGKPFIRSLNIQSILDNYDRLDKDTYDCLKKAVLPQSEDDSRLRAILPEGKLQTIVLRIMPHFIRKNRGSERRRFHDEDVLNLLCSRLDIPQRFLDQASEYVDSGPLLKAMIELEETTSTLEPPPEGLLSGDRLRQWFQKALEAKIVRQEQARLEQELHRRAQLGETHRKHTAALLFLAEQGSFELDGFGFVRIGSRDDYFIYKRTGEYILKDYCAQSYRFPDCRVAVSTAGALRPMVMERYKHPFLLGYASKQDICMRGYDWPSEFTADNIIRVLEDGINALLYGYDARRRNGYHSLDPTLYYVKTIEFVDYRI